jgi:hypothetical protein
MGAEIPDGVFAYRSKNEVIPLSELEKLLVVTACGANTGWNNLIYRAERYAPFLSNYAADAGGRTFPSAAGFHTSQTFFTHDEGVYVLKARSVPPFAEKQDDGSLSRDEILTAVGNHTQKLKDGRLDLPAEVPFTEAHNTWVANRPDVLLGLCYLLQNGIVIADDINKRSIPGIDDFKGIVDVENTWPLSTFEQLSLAEVTVELACSCYAGTLMLQAMGLGGWMFDGLDSLSILGANPALKGLGFRYDTDARWPVPNPTGLMGVMEGYCPPHYPDMRSAVEAVAQRKFGPGGPFDPATTGPWKDSPKVRGAARVHGEEFKDCVALQAQYIYDTFGKFPGTVPSMFAIMYLQAHHLDLDFYDRFYLPGPYLETHLRHMEQWHTA